MKFATPLFAARLLAACATTPPTPPAARAPGAHLLPGQLMAIRQAIGMSKGKPAGLAYLKEFVEDIKASGLVAREIEAEGLKDASVSARAQKMEMRARSLDLHSATIS